MSDEQKEVKIKNIKPFTLALRIYLGINQANHIYIYVLYYIITYYILYKHYTTLMKEIKEVSKCKWKVKITQSCPTRCDPMEYSPWYSPGQNTGVGSFSLLQGIFPTQGLNPGLPHCRQILYQLSHQGSPRILGWAAYPFSSGSSWHRNRTGVSCIAGGFFTNWAMRKA